MTTKTRRPPTAPTPGRPANLAPERPPAAPVEPVEVLGRHKNTGQKDHKGAR